MAASVELEVRSVKLSLQRGMKCPSRAGPRSSNPGVALAIDLSSPSTTEIPMRRLLLPLFFCSLVQGEITSVEELKPVERAHEEVSQ